MEQNLTELMIGSAGEHLVAFDLLMQGVRVSLAAAGSHYDLIAESASGALARVQVKSTNAPPRLIGRRDGVMRFTLTQGRRKKGRASDHADVLAFAFLQPRVVAYVLASEVTGTAVEWRFDPLTVDARGHKVVRGTKYIVDRFKRCPW